jgi:coenzyme F420-reducing hydrogenase delta subunit
VEKLMKIKFYLCENSGYKLYENYKVKKNNWEIVRIPCCGKIEKDSILEDLNENIDKIVIVSCFEGACKYVAGNVRCSKRINSLKKEFEKLNINQDLLELYNFTPNMNDEFKELMKQY